MLFFVQYFSLQMLSQWFSHHLSTPKSIITVVSCSSLFFSCYVPQIYGELAGLFLFLIFCLASLYSTYKWNHSIFIFLFLAYFACHNPFRLHSCCHKWCECIFFDFSVVVCCVYTYLNFLIHLLVLEQLGSLIILAIVKCSNILNRSVWRPLHTGVGQNVFPMLRTARFSCGYVCFVKVWF